MTVGRWGTVSFEIPDVLQDVRDKINDVADFLINVLDIALLALEFIKTVALAFLNPIVLLIEQILALVNNIFDDFRQLGIYITGDWNLVNYRTTTDGVELADYLDLKGGFSEFERRMITRFVDFTDPTRPDVSADTTCLGAFFYLGVDVSALDRLVNFLNQIMSFFNLSLEIPGDTPTPYITQITYGNDTGFGALSNLLTFSSEIPEKAQISWKLSPSQLQFPFNTNATLPPGGFLISISTIPDGIPLKFTRPISGVAKVKDKNGKLYQPREIGSVTHLSKRPIILQGGFDQVGFGYEQVSYNDAIFNGVLQDGRSQVYGEIGDSTNNIIPLDLLKNGDTYFFQKLIYVNLLENLIQWPLEEYSHVIDFKDFPHHAEVVVNNDGTIELKDLGLAQTYYIKVASTYSEIGSGLKLYKYDFSNVPLYTTGAPFTLFFEDGLTEKSISPWSKKMEVKIPNDFVHDYFKATENALLVLILSRPDLLTLDEIESIEGLDSRQDLENGISFRDNVAANRIGLEQFRKLVNNLFPEGYANFLSKARTPLEWRSDVSFRIKDFVKRMYDSGPLPDELYKWVVDKSETLRNIEFDTILKEVGYTKIANKMKNNAENNSLNLMSLLDIEQAGQYKRFGITNNYYSMDVSQNFIDNLVLKYKSKFYVSPSFLVRTRAFNIPRSINNSAELIEQQAFSKFILSSQPELNVETQEYVSFLESQKVYQISGELSPVFYMDVEDFQASNGNTDGSGVLYMRSILSDFRGGVLLSEAKDVLTMVGGPFIRSALDGEWIAIRFFDWFPGFEDLFDALRNWLESLAESFRSITEALVAYIEFLQARIVDLQMLIQKINALIQSLLSYAIGLPTFSGLLVFGQGTQGVLNQFINSEDKPFDSPLTYGGGAAVVIPFAPTFLIELIQIAQGENPAETTLLGGSPSDPSTDLVIL